SPYKLTARYDETSRGSKVAQVSERPGHLQDDHRPVRNRSRSPSPNKVGFRTYPFGQDIPTTSSGKPGLIVPTTTREIRVCRTAAVDLDVVGRGVPYGRGTPG